MADVYSVSLGHYHTVQDGIHGGMQIFVPWMKLTLIDGRADWDRWIMEDDKTYVSWPKSGEWIRTTGTVSLYTGDSGSRLASLRLSRWPWTQGSGGEMDVYREVNGRTKGVYYVHSVE